MAEKTEQPTAKRLRDAREQGNLLSSHEVISTAVVVSGVMAVAVIGPHVPELFGTAIIEAVQLANRPDFAVTADTFFKSAFKLMLLGSGSIFLAVILAGIFSNLFQIGFYFSAAKLGQGIESLNPVTNAENLFSKKTLAQFGINIVKTLIIVGVAYHVISGEKGLVEKIYACRLDTLCGLKVGAETVFMLMMLTVLSMVPVSVIDWLIQRYIYIDSLKMSIDEVQREYKESEGSPEVKGHRRQLAQELINEAGVRRTQSASVVVRNPTHVAIALRYAPDYVKLPYVISKGVGAQAERIIREAERSGIPTYEDVPLAHGLNDACQVNDFVPTDLVEPVAKLVRWLYVNYPNRVYSGPEQKI